MAFIRGASLLCYPELVVELGGDPSVLLQAAGVDPANIGETDAFIAFEGFVNAIEDAAVSLGCMDFGRQLAHRQGVEVFGALGAVATTAPTLGEGLDMVRRYVSVFTPSLEVNMDRGPDESRFWFRTDTPGLRSHPQTMEMLLTRTLDTVSQTVGRGFRPRAVLVPHAPQMPEAHYRSSFGTEVRFEQGHAGLLLATADLARSLDSDAEVHRVVQAYLDASGVRASEDGVAHQVRRIIERSLPGGVVAIEEIAATAGVHPRTLQRHLKDEGATVAQIVEDLRQDLAVRYLRDTTLPFSEVTRLLGYSQQSVLTRACRRWFDATPSQVRDTGHGSS